MPKSPAVARLRSNKYVSLGSFPFTALPLPPENFLPPPPERSYSTSDRPPRPPKTTHRFDSVIGKKKVEEEKASKVEDKLPISNVVLGLLVFVLVGNFFMQFLQTLNTAGGTGGAAPEE